MNKADEIYDEWLVLRCQGGDAKALVILIQRWQPRLLGFAVRVLGDRNAAEDAVQSCWVDVVKRIDTLKDPKSIRPWLFRIVANKCTDTIRKRSKHPTVETALMAEQVADPHAVKEESEASRSDQVAKLRRVMNRLDDGFRQVLRMHYLEELPIEEIAARLSIPAGTVKSRLYHARQKLKQSLSGEQS